VAKANEVTQDTHNANSGWSPNSCPTHYIIGGDVMVIRVYYENDKVKEFDLGLSIIRICDDHGRVIVGEPWPMKEGIILPVQDKEPTPYSD
jgi:hypothetical protein